LRRIHHFYYRYINKWSHFLSVWSYRHRDERIQADLNMLYDSPHPTKASGMVNSSGDSSGKLPYFDLEFSGNVTAVLGKTAILNCRVKDIGNKTVSKFIFN
jgi:hypothetical protein